MNWKTPQDNDEMTGATSSAPAAVAPDASATDNAAPSGPVAAEPAKTGGAVVPFEKKPISPSATASKDWDRVYVIKDKPYALPASLKELGDKYEPLSSLIDMMTYCRPAWSRGDKRFVGKFIWPLGPRPDKFGNFWLKIPGLPGKPSSRILWSSHTDTVHRKSGFQPLYMDDGCIKSLSADCLGADCTTGVWIMCEMIKAGVPGTYVFHRNEEGGGAGSRFIAKHMGKFIGENFDYAIAFDRKDKNSIITHQGSRLGASPEFVASIAPMLPGNYQADAGGTFTDTACYVDYIKECTNLSVGYFSQHTAMERQDILHAMALREKMITFDESRLVAARDPTKKDYRTWEYSDYSENYYGRSWSGYRGKNDTTRTAVRAKTAYERRSEWDREYSIGGAGEASLADVVRRYPERVADWLEQSGWDATALLNSIGASSKDGNLDDIGH